MSENHEVDLADAIAFDTAQYLEYLADLDARLAHPERTYARRRWVILVVAYLDFYGEATFRMEFCIYLRELDARRHFASLCQ